MRTDAQADDSDDPPVRLAAHDRELAEVLVQRDQDARVLMCLRENLRVSWVLLPVACLLRVVPAFAQRIPHRGGDAAVEQQSQSAVSTIDGWMRS